MSQENLSQPTQQHHHNQPPQQQQQPHQIAQHQTNINNIPLVDQGLNHFLLKLKIPLEKSNIYLRRSC